MADGKIIISEYKNMPVVTAFLDDKLEFVSFVRDSELNKIYVGKVDHIVKNLDAAFIRFKDDEIGYLPLKNIVPACVVSSSEFDGKIKAGDEVIVQVEAEAVKTKKCKLTTNICVSGKYSVITLGRAGVGASLKLSDDIRRNLVESTKEPFTKLVDEFDNTVKNISAGMIIRTNVLDIINSYKDNNSDEMDSSMDSSNSDISDKTYSSNGFKAEVIKYPEISDTIIQDARECLNRIKGLLETGKTRTICSCLSDDNTEDSPLNSKLEKATAFLRSRGISEPAVIEDSGIHGINSKIDSLLSNRVWLKSGAYLIIEQLESFNAIDVNTGKAIKGKENISEKVNFEAAEEIMRQIRLRNLTGMILIDFINMKDEEAYKRLTEYVKTLCRLDPVHTSFIDITGLGIMELTRNKNDKTLREIIQEK